MTKISNQPPDASPTATDYIITVDTETGQNKKVLLSSLFSSIVANGSVTPDKLATGAAAAYVVTSQTTTSTSYADLATTTDTVTVTVGANGLAWVSIKARARSNTAAAIVQIGFAISGASTVAANDETGAYIQTPSPNYNVQLTNGGQLVTGLTPGSTTFKMKYCVADGGSGAGTGTFEIRRISVLPL